ncbi:MAG: MarR family transcriptional regulator, partial [Thermoplasmatales archaeon]
MLKDKVLDLLFREDITQKELTSRFNSSRSRMSEVLKKLESQGVVTRRKVSQRTILVSLNHSRTLRIGILRSSEYFHVVSALESLGDRIPFRVTVYDNSLEALKALMTGDEDIVASPLISGYFFYLIDKSIKPIAGIAEGGSGLIKRREKGKIGTTPLSRMDRDSRDIGGYEQV